MSDYNYVTAQQLGIGSIVNAKGFSSSFGGALVAPSVAQAGAAAVHCQVPVFELMDGAGAWLSERLGVPGAIVTSGASAGVQVCVAACLIKANGGDVSQLPHIPGDRIDVLVPRVSHWRFIPQLVAGTGARPILVGDMRPFDPDYDPSTAGVSREMLEPLISPRVAAIYFFLGPQTMDQLRDTVALANAAGLPVIVDAAGQLPPRSHLWELVNLGASFVIFSGGKALRGPQASGLVVGNAELVSVARELAFPRYSIGRALKVGKETVLALLTAVDVFCAGSDDEDLRNWESVVREIVDGVDGVGGATCRVSRSRTLGYPAMAPRAELTFANPRQQTRVLGGLRDGQPRIEIGARNDRYYVDPVALSAGDPKIIVQRLRALLI